MPKTKHIQDEQVLEQALLVISNRGPDTFTLADVAKKVGLAPATLLQRFGSKQRLLTLAAKHASTKLSEDLSELKAKKLPCLEELVSLLSDIPEGFGSRQDIANSLGLLRLDMTDPELHPHARKLFELLRKRVFELLLQAKAKGQISTKKKINTLSWELDALRHGLVIQWTLSGKGTIQNWISQGIKNYLEHI